jgi:transposase
VLSYSRQIFLQFFFGNAMANFLRGHVGAFASFGGIPRVLLYDYVSRHIIVVLCPSPLCGAGGWGL